MNKRDLILEDYSEKSFVIKGNTQPYKEELKLLGGKWNSRLSKNDEIFGAWIYPSTKKNDLLSWLSNEKDVKTITSNYKYTLYDNDNNSNNGNNDKLYLEISKLSKKIDELYKLVLDIKNNDNSVIIEEDDEDDEEEIVKYNKSHKKLLKK